MLSALVIDDELFAREELTELLEETGHIEVLDQASNAIEGLKKINQLKPDVVFLDIQMPQITGIELLAMLDRKICAHVNYECAGTLEFLMDMDSGKFYFIEVNPRVNFLTMSA